MFAQCPMWPLGPLLVLSAYQAYLDVLAKDTGIDRS